MALVDLPPELLLRVSAFLTTTELGNLRLTSKPIESVLFDNFAREFFTKKQFMLEQPSLQALIDISNHPTLGSRLSEVVISTHVLPSDSDIVSPTSRAMYAAGHVNHHVLMASGQALHMLSDAFSNLPNLRTVGLRDYNGLGRYRDGKFATWKSWGWSFGWEGLPTYDPNDRSTQLSLETISPEPILPLLFYALGHARVLPESIHVFLRKRSKLTQQSFNILDGYLGDKIRPVLGNMKELMLAIGNDTIPHHYSHFVKFAKSNIANNLPLARLLQRTPKLETLRLNFEPGQRFASDFLHWLGSPVPTQAPCTGLVITPVSLPRLTALELGMATVSTDTLFKVLTKFNLESFSLWKVKLHATSASEPEDCWQALLHDLAAALHQESRLKSVLIGYPSQLHHNMGDLNRDAVCLFRHASAAEDDISELSQEAKHFAGPGTIMADWLEGLSKRTYVPPPYVPDYDSMNEHEEDGTDEEESDDSIGDYDSDSEDGSEDD
ncbi:hypothetical protein E4T50_12951 [Aureobasidium sp. EXF-12298]|nr:hypothetical protein E4T50_12951 [Aureobasidium sp. EXF-12298]